ncbi:hypothetical protein NS365_21445 [Aureimonas ureilytica]|uniref:Uncharacterized protein n=1 Tax=Aureimonas ureilytica TaxID=401562 RepID=A0A175RGZ2_9HYPH|nr:hypothetical protein [Aureimonas ureilytica]KTR02553.1 hypothetical protein NS365_21445 [Aureimonas ureilytica]
MAEKKPDAEHPKAAAVRKAADALYDALDAARAVGLAVTWPSRPEDLLAILISETGSVRDAAEADDLTGIKVETRPATAD